MRIFAVVGCALLLAACGGSSASSPQGGGASKPGKPAKLPPESTTYYLGTSQASGADGTPFGPPQPALVERIVKPAHKTIIETVLVDSRMLTTTLTQSQRPHVFEAIDEIASFTGTLTYEGPMWAFTRWHYDIILADGKGRIEGFAEIKLDRLHIEKFFVGPGGERQVRIVEDLKKITRSAFEAKRTELTGGQ